MSVEGLRWALNTVEGLQGATRTVLIYLGDYADCDSHVAWPRHETLAKKVGVHRETVTRVLQRLVDVGLIEPRDPPENVVEWARRRGRFAPCAYYLRLDRSRPVLKPKAARVVEEEIEVPDPASPCDLRSQGETAPPCDLRSPGPCDLRSPVYRKNFKYRRTSHWNERERRSSAWIRRARHAPGPGFAGSLSPASGASRLFRSRRAVVWP